MALVTAKAQLALLPCKGVMLQASRQCPAHAGPAARKGPPSSAPSSCRATNCRGRGAVGGSVGTQLGRRDVLRASGIAMASLSLPFSCFSSAGQAVCSPAFIALAWQAGWGTRAASRPLHAAAMRQFEGGDVSSLPEFWKATVSLRVLCVCSSFCVGPIAWPVLSFTRQRLTPAQSLPRVGTYSWWGQAYWEPWLANNGLRCARGLWPYHGKVPFGHCSCPLPLPPLPAGSTVAGRPGKSHRSTGPMLFHLSFTPCPCRSSRVPMCTGRRAPTRGTQSSGHWESSL